MNGQEQVEQTGFAFEAGKPEHDRLVRMSRVMDPHVRDTCDRLELAPGAKVIEFGCGALGALLPLSAAVGPDGVVVGLDRNGEALDTARSILAARGTRNVYLVRADLNTFTPGDVCSPGLFDLAYCHFVLCYQRDVAAALRRMATVVRPGGYLVAQEVVFTTPIPIGAPGPFVPAANLLMNEWVPALLGRLGMRWDVARQFSAICQEAGLVEVDQRVFAPSLSPTQASVGISAYHDILVGARSLLPRFNIASQDEVDRVLGELKMAQEQTHEETVFTHLRAELAAQVV